MADFQKVARKNDIPEGTGRTVEVAGQQIAVFNAGGSFYAVQGVCPHRGGPLGEGDVEGKTVTCPWHAWQFDLSTGASLFNPTSVKTYAVKIEGEDVLVAL